MISAVDVVSTGAPWWGQALVAGFFTVVGAGLGFLGSWQQGRRQARIAAQQRWDKERLTAFADYIEKADHSVTLVRGWFLNDQIVLGLVDTGQLTISRAALKSARARADLLGTSETRAATRKVDAAIDNVQWFQTREGMNSVLGPFIPNETDEARKQRVGEISYAPTRAFGEAVETLTRELHAE